MSNFSIEQQLKGATVTAVKDLFGVETSMDKVIVNDTRKEFEGDLTVVVFPFVKIAKRSPQQTGDTIGAYLQEKFDFITGFNTIQGFLNLNVADTYWLQIFNAICKEEDYGQNPPTGKKVVLEYCGPNTNKPLHLGHIRNMLLGFATANILSAAGDEVHKVNIYNDRGIAICKSMLGWQKYANGTTPESEGMKGDHFVGKWYVKYATEFGKEYKVWQETAEGKQVFEEWQKDEKAVKKTLKDIEAAKKKKKKEGKEIKKEDYVLQNYFFKNVYEQTYANTFSKLGAEIAEMLRKWEANDPKVRKLWEMNNQWVYEGLQKTFDKLGVDFEKDYMESDNYLQGKEMALKGLEDGLFYQKEDGSVWVDLEDKKLDQKLLLRKDGTSVYITQDLAVAENRYADYQMDDSIYVVGDAQAYHFKVLQATLQKMGKPYADGIHHLGYGMVFLPSGKMKSREGDTVDADDLIAQMIQMAEELTQEQGKVESLSDEEMTQLYKTLGLGALKYFILRIGAKKSFVFNPKDSIDFQGDTGTYIQYNYARSQAILRKYDKDDYKQTFSFDNGIESLEKELIMLQYKYPSVISEAATNYDPSIITAYAYNLAKTFSKFWSGHSILGNADEKVTAFRVALTANNARIIKSALNLLGMEVPSRM
ncbi:MAG: arginine--tRNA ligase [Chitinophagales bacterium]